MRKKIRAITFLVESIMLYVAVIWTDYRKYQSYGAHLARVQWKISIKITRTDRTVSAEAATSLASLLSIDIKSQERKATFQHLNQSKLENRVRSLNA